MKNRVKTAKKKTWIYISLTPIVFVVLYFGFLTMLKGMQTTMPLTDYMLSQIRFSSYLVAGVGTFCFYYISYILTWNNLKREVSFHKSERLVFHYNLCLRLINENEYKKALITYNGIFGNSNQSVAHIIRVALKVAYKEPLEDELITMENVL